MKVADFADDAEILGKVEQLAGEILKTDPKLERAGHEGLKANVARLFGGAGKFGWN